MKKEDVKYGAYVQILKEELVPAMGCTEPIALAYAAAKAREVLGEKPDTVKIGASGSIIKNVKSVIVPNTDHLKGIPAAAAAGIIAGKPEKELEVIAEVSKEQIEEMKDFLQNADISVEYVDNGITFDIIVTETKGESSATVRIANYHTNIVLIEKNGQVLFEEKVEGEKEEGLTDRSLLNMKDILDFAETVDIDDVREVIGRQIRYNTAIAEEGLKGNYGANIGSVLLEMEGDNIRVRAKAMAAAGSDARMNGCELPVIINSGSGNQGMTCSLPVIEYAKELNSGEEKLYRALTLSNLVAIHQKTGIGRLSAYCGAVCAGAAAGAGIAYLHGGGYEEIAHTVVNALAIVSGIVCDGAKASCAAKIASSVEAGILGYNMYKCGQQFYAGDGIVTKGVDETIKNIGRLGKEGMRETNVEIIDIMVGEGCK
ncbi:serine dehydratase subunit alpha family protein [Ruminococcus sp. OM05-10BH]|nr:serine dehydratase subunit alpha family protein [Ruminococcus sp. OM05-10BH]